MKQAHIIIKIPNNHDKVLIDTLWKTFSNSGYKGYEILGISFEDMPEEK